ncbi:MAG: 16S rRNA (uracil(1498)-N(3))-methyltransferase [Planctomycetaceae bacterium]|jgi:16S rRNA (uracil1498-N3)-methyltransferase|nr:16S rRNA (uracil(1498)-N(3))-methyltransferase [Planctomycetaceae bacterium]
MSSRFFLDPKYSRLEQNHASLGGDEARHFTKVMRGKTGSEIILFDGTGFSYLGIVENIGKKEVNIRILHRLADETESPLRLTVAAALPKGDRQRFLIEKLAELGTARFLPVSMERSVARADNGTIDRFKRYVIEAAKQCGRNVLMEIAGEIPLQKLCREFGKEISEKSCTKFILHPLSLGNIGQTSPKQIFAEPLPAEVMVLAGPEGSFTDHEIESAQQAGFRPLELGKRILRTETACVAAAAVFLTSAG